MGERVEADELLAIYEHALSWYADWEANVTSGIHDHATEDGESVPDMGRRAHDALLGIDVRADGYERSIEASQLAAWKHNAEEPRSPRVPPARFLDTDAADALRRELDPLHPHDEETKAT